MLCSGCPLGQTSVCVNGARRRNRCIPKGFVQLEGARFLSQSISGPRIADTRILWTLTRGFFGLQGVKLCALSVSPQGLMCSLLSANQGDPLHRMIREEIRRPLKTTLDMTTLIISAGWCPLCPVYSFKKGPWYPFSWLVTENPSREVATKDHFTSNPRKGNPPDLKTKLDVSKVDVKGFPNRGVWGACSELARNLLGIRNSPEVCSEFARRTARTSHVRTHHFRAGASLKSFKIGFEPGNTLLISPADLSK